jgi:hypothetical protein
MDDVTAAFIRGIRKENTTMRYDELLALTRDYDDKGGSVGVNELCEFIRLICRLGFRTGGRQRMLAWLELTSMAARGLVSRLSDEQIKSIEREGIVAEDADDNIKVTLSLSADEIEWLDVLATHVQMNPDNYDLNSKYEVGTYGEAYQKAYRVLMAISKTASAAERKQQQKDYDALSPF